MYMASRSQRASVWPLHFNSFLITFGFFILIPLVTVHYVLDLGMAASLVGFVLAVRLFLQQGLTIFGGAAADRLGYKPLLVAGLAVRAVGFAGFIFASTLPMVLAVAVVSALGGAMFDSTSKAALVAIVPPRQRARQFSILNLMGNAGMLAGPIVGVALMKLDFQWVAGGSAVVFGLASLQTLLFLRPVESASASGALLAGVRSVWSDRKFVAFTAIMAGYWFVSQQLGVLLPLYVVRRLGDQSALGILYTVNSVLILALQYPLIRLVSRRLSPVVSVGLGISVISLSLALMGAGQSLPWMIGCIALFAAGAAVIDPTYNAYVSSVASPAHVGSYFGFGALGLAVGGASATYAAGVLFELSSSVNRPELPWTAAAVAGGAVSGLLFAYRYLELRAKSAAPAQRPQPAGAGTGS